MPQKIFTNVIIPMAFTEAASDVTVEGGNNHASNISGSPTEQDLALAFGKIQNWYNNWNPVVWTGNASKVSGHTVAKDVPSTAVFTDTTFSLSGAASDDTYVITLTPSSGTATTATVPAGSTSTYGLVKLSTSTSSTSTSLAATPSAVKSAYDLAAGKSTVSFTQTMTSGSEVGTLTIDGTAVTLYAPAGTGNDRVMQQLKSDNKMYPLLFSVFETSNTSASPAADFANRNNSIYVNPSTGTLTATNFLGTVNGFTIGKTVPADAVFTDTTYTFAEGSTNGAFTVTPAGGSAKTISIHGLGSAAYEATTAFVPAKPDGTVDFLDSGLVVNSKYLPSYVDDTVEVLYDATTGKIYDPDSPTTELTPEKGKIYVDVSTPTKADGPTYRWSGSAWISLKSPSVDALSDVIYKSNGVITRKYTNAADADLTIYTHPTTAGNKHIPTGGGDDSSGVLTAYASGSYAGFAVLMYGGSSGTAKWGQLNNFTGATASAAGTRGIVPAPAADTYNANGNRHYLRSDGAWSDDPVTTADTLVLHVVAGS